MKRLMLFCTVCFCLLIAPLPLAHAQAGSPGSNNWETLTYEDGHKKQQTIQVLRGFKKLASCPKPEDRRPEIIYLRLNDDQDHDFKGDPVAYVNRLDALSCKVDAAKGLRRLVLARRPKPAAKGSDPIEVVIHDPDCGGTTYEATYIHK